MLSCSCEWDGDGWWYVPQNKFKGLDTKKRRRCASCKELIDLGSDCIEFNRFREPLDDIEQRIWGDEVQLASKYLCDWCGQMYLNLDHLGYCYYLGDSIRENLEDYWNLTGFEPKNK